MDIISELVEALREVQTQVLSFLPAILVIILGPTFSVGAWLSLVWSLSAVKPIKRVFKWCGMPTRHEDVDAGTWWTAFALCCFTQYMWLFMSLIMGEPGLIIGVKEKGYVDATKVSWPVRFAVTWIVLSLGIFPSAAIIGSAAAYGATGSRDVPATEKAEKAEKSE
jgi:hypothetical protein